jgi:hypothetical protein
MVFDASHLSQENVLRDVHDPVTQSLRTTASATIVSPPAFNVVISHTDDSIRIGDGTQIFTGGTKAASASIPVTLSSEDKLKLDRIDSFANLRSGAYTGSVAAAINTTIFTYTVPVGKKLRVSTVEAGGSNIAQFSVLVNGSDFGRKRTYFGSQLYLNFDLYSYEIAASGTISVDVIHNRPSVGTFEAWVIGELIDV